VVQHFTHFYVLIDPGFSRLKYWYTVIVDLPTNTEILPIGIFVDGLSFRILDGINLTIM